MGTHQGGGSNTAPVADTGNNRTEAPDSLPNRNNNGDSAGIAAQEQTAFRPKNISACNEGENHAVYQRNFDAIAQAGA
ncbi:MAG: hypothetical protein HZA20_05125 [Nitrospirae bacterium]|nr:hypothetical protein [Nitrospirota bacterium]